MFLTKIINSNKAQCDERRRAHRFTALIAHHKLYVLSQISITVIYIYCFMNVHTTQPYATSLDYIFHTTNPTSSHSTISLKQWNYFQCTWLTSHCTTSKMYILLWLTAQCELESEWVSVRRLIIIFRVVCNLMNIKRYSLCVLLIVFVEMEVVDWVNGFCNLCIYRYTYLHLESIFIFRQTDTTRRHYIVQSQKPPSLSASLSTNHCLCSYSLVYTYAFGRYVHNWGSYSVSKSTKIFENIFSLTIYYTISSVIIFHAIIKVVVDSTHHQLEACAFKRIVLPFRHVGCIVVVFRYSRHHHRQLRRTIIMDFYCVFATVQKHFPRFSCFPAVALYIMRLLWTIGRHSLCDSSVVQFDY